MKVTLGSCLLLLLVFVVVGGCQSLTSSPNVGKITDVAGSATDAVKGTAGVSTGVVSKVSNVAKDGATTQDVADAAANTTQDVVDFAANTTQDVADEAANTTQGVVDFAANTTQDVVDFAANTTQDVVDEAANTTQDVADVAANTTQDVVDEAANTTQDVADEAANTAQGVADAAANTTQDVADVAANTTQDVADEAANTAQDVADAAANTTQDVVDEAANTTQDVVDEAANTTQDVVDAAANTTQDGEEDAVDTVIDIVVDMLDPDDVCYDGLDCFSMSSPWYTILRPLPKPQSPAAIDTQFYLYTRRHPGRYTVTWRYSNKTDADADADADGGMTLNGSDFDGSKKTFFITHGFSSNGNVSWMAEMKDALLKKFDCNVFLVDWGKGASQLNYFQVASNTRVVAAVLAKLGHFLIDKHNADPTRMHAIGHSLGAQISAYFGKNMTTLGRLTALDPAQPAFEHYDRRVRLDRDDAALVDVVHTSARPFIPFFGLGMVGAYGHIDFYMNGGWNQPGCVVPESVNISSFQDLANLPVEDLSSEIGCPHLRAYKFFTASLEINNTFWGHRINLFKKFISTLTGGYGGKVLIPDDDDCGADKCSPFGYDAFEYPARGKFEVGTTDAFPFVVPEPKVDACMLQFRGLQPSADSKPT